MAAVASVLHISRAGESLRTHKLEAETVLGRAEGCVIRLDDRAISRQHAVFRPISGGVQVEKKSDFAPLMINGADTDQALLKDGDVISIGPYLVRIQITKEAPPAPVAEAKQPELDPPSVEATDVAPTIVSEPSQSLQLDSEQSADQPVPEPEQSNQMMPFDQSTEEAASAEAAAPVEDYQGISMPPAVGSDFADPDSDGHTKFVPQTGVSVRLSLPPGMANYEEIELTRDEITIGRGKICDIVLNDKKSSRKHAVIRRAGLSFIIKDLQSANGTFVNGIRVDEQELSGDDEITVGEVTFRFLAVSTEYANQQQDFLQVEEEPHAAVPDVGQETPAFGAEFNALMQPDGYTPSHGTLSNIPGIATPGSFGKEQKGFIADLRNLRNLPPKRRLVVGFLALSLFYFIFLDDEDEQEVQIRERRPAAAAQANAAKKNFANLSPDLRRQVETHYNLAFDHFQNKDFDKALYEIQKLFSIIDDYKNSRELEKYAKEGKRKSEAIEEEKRRKAREEQHRAMVQQLVDETRELMKQKHFEQARELFTNILAKDPDNKDVSQWKAEIQDWEEQQAAELQRKQVADAKNQKASEILAEAVALRKKGSCHAAIEVFQQGLAMEPTAADLVKKLNGGIAGCKALIARLRAPVLEAAKEAEQAKEYAKAYKLFERVSRIDPPHPAGPAGMGRIKGKLHEIAKSAYAEAVVAEGYSDLTTARRLYEEIIRTVPKDDPYYKNAERRLTRYVVLDRNDAERKAAEESAAAEDEDPNRAPADADLGGQSE